MTDWDDPRSVLARYGQQPKKSFGQNFLIARPVVERIAEACVPDPSRPSLVVEIGAGLGTLTRALVARAGTVVAIERDRDMLPILQAELGTSIAEGKLALVEADAAQVDVAALLSEHVGSGPGERVLCGNLPYQITGRLIELATGASSLLTRAVFMVQREVADRLMAAAGSEAYGQSTVFVQAAFSVERVMVVRAGCFHPAPRVDSAVVSLTPRPVPRARETRAFQAVVHAAFGARRKTLRNALRAWLSDPLRAERVASTGIDLQRRGETLEVEEFARLAEAIGVGPDAPDPGTGASTPVNP